MITDPIEESETEESEETETVNETVKTVFHEVTETTLIYDYNLLIKVIFFDTLICGTLIYLIVRWNKITVKLSKVFKKKKAK